MIPVARSPQPLVLQKNAARWLSELKSLKDNLDTDKRRKNIQGKYGHPQVKDALVKMFNGKCAYCESKITVVTYGAIEHFFPKSQYIDLTFEWSNLLLSCDVCNDASHKGANFPLDSCTHPILINPTDGITDPNTHLEFVWDSVAGLAIVDGRDERGKIIENIFDLNGINGRKELIAHRSQYLKKLLALLRFAQAGDKEVVALLKECCDASSEYSAFLLVYIHPYLPS